MRVERGSRDCFKDGGALAEVMTLYENMDEDNSKENSEGNHRLAIEVRNFEQKLLLEDYSFCMLMMIQPCFHFFVLYFLL